MCREEKKKLGRKRGGKRNKVRKEDVWEGREEIG